MNIREHPKLIPIPLPRRTQAHPNSHYSPLQRTTDPSRSKITCRQTHLRCNATRSTTWSACFKRSKFSICSLKLFLSPSSSSSSARRRVLSPLLVLLVLLVLEQRRFFVLSYFSRIFTPYFYIIISTLIRFALCVVVYCHIKEV